MQTLAGRLVSEIHDPVRLPASRPCLRHDHHHDNDDDDDDNDDDDNHDEDDD